MEEIELQEIKPPKTNGGKSNVYDDANSEKDDSESGSAFGDIREPHPYLDLFDANPDDLPPYLDLFDGIANEESQKVNKKVDYYKYAFVIGLLLLALIVGTSLFWQFKDELLKSRKSWVYILLPIPF